LERQIKELEGKKTDSSNGAVWIALIVTWLVLIVLIVFFSKEYIKRVIVSSRRLEETFALRNENYEIHTSHNSVTNNIDELSQNENFINTIVDRVQECLLLNAKENTSNKQTNKETGKKQPVKYLKGKSGKTFSIVSDTPDGCFFKLVNEKDGTAEFEYCGNIDDARSQFNSIFDNVCDTEGSAQNAKEAETKRGKVKFTDGKWEVTEKAKIKFI
jgi:hypothetical protein